MQFRVEKTFTQKCDYASINYRKNSNPSIVHIGNLLRSWRQDAIKNSPFSSSHFCPPFDTISNVKLLLSPHPGTSLFSYFAQNDEKAFRRWIRHFRPCTLVPDYIFLSLSRSGSYHVLSFLDALHSLNLFSRLHFERQYPVCGYEPIVPYSYQRKRCSISVFKKKKGEKKGRKLISYALHLHIIPLRLF